MTYLKIHLSCALISIVLQILMTSRINKSAPVKGLNIMFKEINKILASQGLNLSIKDGILSSKYIDRHLEFPGFPKTSYLSALPIAFFVQSLILGPLQVLLLTVAHIAISGAKNDLKESDIKELHNEIATLSKRLNRNLNDEREFAREIAMILNQICKGNCTNEIYWNFMSEHFDKIKNKRTDAA